MSINLKTHSDEKVSAKQFDTNTDYSIIPSSVELVSLDLVTALEIENRHSQHTSPKPELKCKNDELCGIQTSRRRYRKKLIENTHIATDNPTFEISTAQLTNDTSEGYIDSELTNYNLRRHSHEDYDIECDSTEDYFSKIPSKSSTTPVVDTIKFASEIQTHHTTEYLPLIRNDFTSPPLFSTIGEPLRRMSESEEVVTECDSFEDHTVINTIVDMTASSVPMQTLITSSPDHVVLTDRTLVTESMRRMSESEEMEMDCEYDGTPIHHPVTEDFSTTQLGTTPTPETLAMNGLSRRMSESDVNCTTNESESQMSQMNPIGNDVNIISPIVDSMRRMTESNENSSDCDSHEDFVEVTTVAPILSGSMRRMSRLEKLTTELNADDPTEYVSECVTEISQLNESDNSTEMSGNVHKTAEIRPENALQCCPDSVCSMIYPSVPVCAEKKLVNYFHKVRELRDMFYVYKTQVLITQLVARDSDYLRKRRNYERSLVNLWNDMLSRFHNDIIDSCTRRTAILNDQLQTISSIFCFLTRTNNVLNNSLLKMILNTVRRIETDFTKNKILTYPKLRRIIWQSIPKPLSRSDQVSTLSNYMLHNRNLEIERMFLLRLLFNVQQGFGNSLRKYFVNPTNSTDPTRSLQ